MTASIGSEMSSDPDRDREAYEADLEDDATGGIDIYALFVLDTSIPSTVCHFQSACMVASGMLMNCACRLSTRSSEMRLTTKRTLTTCGSQKIITASMHIAERILHCTAGIIIVQPSTRAGDHPGLARAYTKPPSLSATLLSHLKRLTKSSLLC